ncbi:MAG: hypothetical protein DWQ21_04560 [Bacteroidetes bacterium]|jgi:hypothetical protein|nr:MAG: hypothetical protein DWQ21_04560 [Bacteroidota bacterium]REK62581.1 MAG: hypothetical protein DWQ49_03615 [Bacteroidota bacterium]
MKKFLASLFAAAAFASPVLAEDKVKTWRSFDSLGCMMLRECKEDVVELTTWSELGPEYGIAAEELDAIIAALKKVGATIYLADERYFAFRMRGVYDVRFNNIFLNKFYLDQPTKMIQVIRHEGWHTAQDCMAGTLENTFTALIFPEEDVPDWIRRGAERTYAKNVLPFEAEAMWAMYIEDKTKEALEVCAGPKKMWEYYSPTPLTGEWLEQEGFIKKKS